MLGVREAFRTPPTLAISDLLLSTVARITHTRRETPSESGKKLGTTAAARNSIMVSKTNLGNKPAEVGPRQWIAVDGNVDGNMSPLLHYI